MVTYAHVYNLCGFPVYLQNLVLPNGTFEWEHVHALNKEVSKCIAKQERRFVPVELEFLRLHLGFSKKEFASFFGVRKSDVSLWEQGVQTTEIHHEAALRRFILRSSFIEPPDIAESLTWNTRVLDPEKLYYVFEASDAPRFVLIKSPSW